MILYPTRRYPVRHGSAVAQVAAPGFAGSFGAYYDMDWPIITVQNLNDSGAGSLRQAFLDADGTGTIVRFADSMQGVITLSANLPKKNNIALLGFGADITLQAGTEIPTSHAESGNPTIYSQSQSIFYPVGTNFVARNLTVRRCYDGFQTTSADQGAWLDHITFEDIEDGSVDVSSGYQGITLSNIWFRGNSADGSAFVFLVGDSDSACATDVNHRVTAYGCKFGDPDNGYTVTIRCPRLRFGRAHFYNNWLDKPTGFVAGVSLAFEAQFLSEHNVYERLPGSSEPALVHISDSLPTGGCTQLATAYCVSNGDFPLNGAVIETNGSVFAPPYTYDFEATTQAGVQGYINANVGWRDIPWPG